MSKYLIALDQSTQTTGYAIFKDGSLLTHGHVDPTGEDYIERIAKLRQWVEKIIQTLSSDNDTIEIGIEDIQLQNNNPNGGGYQRDFGVTTFKKLAHVQGALLSLFAEKNIPYQIIVSSSWKKTCGITGSVRNQQKKNAQLFVANTYNVKATQDEADAICLGTHILQTKGHDWT